MDPATGRKFSQDQLPISAFLPTADVAAAEWPYFPGTGIVGDLGRNTFWTHGQNNWDVAFIKNVRIYGERHNVQFRAEMFNLMNRVPFDIPAYVSVVDMGVAGWRQQPRFGEIARAAQQLALHVQMSLRYIV